MKQLEFSCSVQSWSTNQNTPFQNYSIIPIDHMQSDINTYSHASQLRGYMHFNKTIYYMHILNTLLQDSFVIPDDLLY